MEKMPVAETFTHPHFVYLQCSEKGVIEYVSENVHDIFDQPAEFYLHKNIISFLSGSQYKSIIYHCKGLNNTHSSRAFTITLIGSKGESVGFCIDVKRRKEGSYFCTLIPLAEHDQPSKKADEEFYRQLELMRTTLDSMDDIVFVLDENNNFSSFYSQSTPLFSQGAQAFAVGTPFSDTGFPDEIIALFLQAIKETKKDAAPKDLDFSLDAFGGKLYYQAKISPRFTSNNQYDGVTVVLRDISGQVKSEEELKSSLDYYLIVLNNFPNPIWRCNTLKKFDYFNKQWKQFTGNEADELTAEQWKASIHPDDRENIAKLLLASFSERKPLSLEYRLMHSDGKFRWIKNFCQPLFDIKGRFTGYMGSCFDIDDIRRTQSLLQESESRYKAMVEDQGDMVIRWTSDYKVSFANKSFGDFFLTQPAELQGSNWLNLFKGQNRKSFKKHLDKISKQKKRGFFVSELTNSQGKKVFYQWLNSPVLGKNDQIIEYQSVGRDITDITEKEKENKSLLIKLNDKVKELSLINSVSRCINDLINIEELLGLLANNIATLLGDHKNIVVAIEFDGKKYFSDNYTETTKSEKVDYPFGGQGRKEGVVRIIKPLEENEVGMAVSVLDESEKQLLKTLLEMVSSYVLKIETDLKLHSSEQRFRELFENVVDIVFSIDPSGKVLQINSAAENILGYTSFEDMLLWDIIIPSQKQENLLMLRTTIEEKKRSFKFETKVLSQKGNVVFLQIGGIIKYLSDGTPCEIFGIARDITEQRRLEQNIMKTVINTEEKERKRFAEDLHDGIGPLLSGLKMYLQQDAFNSGLNPKQKKVLNYCREIVDDAISQARSISNNITPAVLNDFGLEKALIAHIAKINDIGKFKAELDIRTSLDSVEKDVGLALFRVIAELVNNALKHAAGCTRIGICIDIKNNILSLVYNDNGEGFDPQASKKATSGSRMGIGSMKNRIQSLNGSFTLKSKIGEGVFVKIYLPV